MQNSQLKTPMLNTKVLQIQTQSESQSAFITRYNQVINAYNKYAQDGSPKMQVMVGNKFLTKISECLSRPVLIVVLSLIMLIVPVINIFCLGCIFAYLLYLRRQNKKHVRNLHRVNDPFEHFFFIPEMCESIGKHYATIDLEQNQIAGFTFNEELRNKLQTKIQDQGSGISTNKLTVLIYDQYFYDSYHLYKKQFYKTLVWLLASLFFIAISTILYLSVLI